MLYKDMPSHLQHTWQVSSGSGPNTEILHVDNSNQSTGCRQPIRRPIDVQLYDYYTIVHMCIMNKNKDPQRNVLILHTYIYQ